MVERHSHGQRQFRRMVFLPVPAGMERVPAAQPAAVLRPPVPAGDGACSPRGFKSRSCRCRTPGEAVCRTGAPRPPAPLSGDRRFSTIRPRPCPLPPPAVHWLFSCWPCGQWPMEMGRRQDPPLRLHDQRNRRRATAPQIKMAGAQPPYRPDAQFGGKKVAGTPEASSQAVATPMMVFG